MSSSAVDGYNDITGCISQQPQQPKRSMEVVYDEPERTSHHQMKIMLEELQAEYDAFRESSAELEKELERELERLEVRARQAETVLKAREEAHRHATAGLRQQVIS